MGHRDPSAEELGGHFSMSEHADEWADAMEDRYELQRLLWEHKPVSESTFTKEHYPNEPRYMLFQNMQMCSMSSNERQIEALARIRHATFAKVGETIQCPGCSHEMVKTSYQHKFCKEKISGRSTCKDFINNWFDPDRLYRTLLRNKVAKTESKQVSPEMALITKWLADGTITKQNLQSILSK